jgi:hypothetical protein
MCDIEDEKEYKYIWGKVNINSKSEVKKDFI